jgi:uncharacterized SAM-dependent methyltransferase
MESFLISLEAQTIAVDDLGHSFSFQPYEPIHLEYSFKYILPQIEELAYDGGFTILQNFTDPQRSFVDSLWQVQN